VILITKEGVIYFLENLLQWITIVQQIH
jgi:hypothetical protein